MMENKTILLLGSTGMAGNIIYQYLDSLKKYKIINVSYRNKLTESTIILDIKNVVELEQLILKVKPDYIINCIGILIKGSADTENAIYINAYFPHLLKKTAKKVNAKLIHLSTDCVFTGNVGNYKEDSFRDADDVYGRSKALGEINENNHLTIRTSIIGPELKSNGEGLFHWFMSQKGEVIGYTNAIWGGVTTLELAKAIAYCLDNNLFLGLIHLTNGKNISKFNLLKIMKSVWNLENVEIIEGLSKKNVNKSLTKSKLLEYNVPSYEEMFDELRNFMIEYKFLYPLYSINKKND